MFGRLIILTLTMAALAFLPACKESHDTPEATIAALRTSVEEGRADKLTNYIYAENQDMRRLLNRMGRLLGNLQKLGVAVNEKFPAEVAQLRADAQAAAKSGKSSSFISELLTQQRRGNRRSVQVGVGAKHSSPDKLRDSFNETMKQLFTDPYAWIEQSERRLSTEFLTDDSVAVLWDGQPVFPPLGMVMKRDLRDGNWYFVLPSHIPGASNIFPKTEKEFQIWGGLITVFDQMIIDLTKEVQDGRVTTIDDLSRKAGEMAFMPAMITVFAYGKLEENQRKEAKAAKAAEAAAVKPPAPETK